MRTKPNLLLSLLAVLAGLAALPASPAKALSPIRVGRRRPEPGDVRLPVLQAAEDQAHALLRAGRRHARSRRAREGDGLRDRRARAGVSTLMHISTPTCATSAARSSRRRATARDVNRLVATSAPSASRLRRLERGQPQDAGDVEPRRQRRLVLQEHVPGGARALPHCDVVAPRHARPGRLGSLHPVVLRAPELDVAQAREDRRHPQLLRRQPQPLDAAREDHQHRPPLQPPREVLVHGDRRAGELRPRPFRTPRRARRRG